jgi:hypothetical protein
MFFDYLLSFSKAMPMRLFYFFPFLVFDNRHQTLFFNRISTFIDKKKLKKKNKRSNVDYFLHTYNNIDTY